MQIICNIDIIRTGSKIALKSNDDLLDLSFRVKHPLELNERLIRDEQTEILNIRHMSQNKTIQSYFMKKPSLHTYRINLNSASRYSPSFVKQKLSCVINIVYTFIFVMAPKKTKLEYFFLTKHPTIT